MGEVMQERMGQGDVAANLGVTSLVANAYLLTGDDKYRRWVLDYVDAWMERARANGGLLPDNVGLSGAVGEYMDGKWYGGLYGWSWPHGFYNIGTAATVRGAQRLPALTRDAGYLDLPRWQMRHILALGETRDGRRSADEPAPSLDRHASARWTTGARPSSCRIATAILAGSTISRCRPSTRRRCGTLSMAERGLGPLERICATERLRLAAVDRLPHQGRLRPRAAVAALPGRRQPGLPGGDPAPRAMHRSAGGWS